MMLPCAGAVVPYMDLVAPWFGGKWTSKDRREKIREKKRWKKIHKKQGRQ